MYVFLNVTSVPICLITKINKDCGFKKKSNHVNSDMEHESTLADNLAS